ncbi:MAG TPA: hypothetical protein VF268_02345 [Gammaproteobacteria bacterium]|jgi:hypothetical protein
MSSERYRVVFVGQVEPGRDPEKVKADLAAKFKLKPAVIKRIMAGRPIVVKNNLDAEMAFRYKTEIDAVGALSRIEPVPAVNDLDELGYIERRKGERRTGLNDRRRSERGSSIQPDRRTGRDRRKKK